jgi:hypothetical protein
MYETYLFIYLFNHILTKACKAYAGQKKPKSHPYNLSYLVRPPNLLYPIKSAIQRKGKQKENYDTTRLSLPLAITPLSPSSLFLASLYTTLPCLSPLFFICVASPRLLFPSTIWTLMPPALMTSAYVFSVEVVFGHSW